MKIILIPPPECVPPHNLGLKYSPFFDKKIFEDFATLQKGENSCKRVPTYLRKSL